MAEMNEKETKLAEILIDGKERYTDGAKLCAVLLHRGHKNKKEVFDATGISKGRFDSLWHNLKKGEYFGKSGKLVMDEGKDDLPFILMLLTAEGLVARKLGKTE